MKSPNNNKRMAAKSKRPNGQQKVVQTLLKLGAPKLFAFSCLLAIAIGALGYYYFISPASDVNQSLRDQLMQKRKTNAISRMVQQTKPDFLKEFRRVVDAYTTARELLPTEVEVSNVLDGIQQMARQNNVRVTMFDASKPGAKPTNPVQAANNNQPATVDQSQPQTTLNERVMPAQVQGTHAAIARFLGDVARYPRIIYVKDFSITTMTHGQENMNLTLVTYDAPTSGTLPPIPPELQKEFQPQGNKASSSNKVPCGQMNTPPCASERSVGMLALPVPLN